MLDGSYQRHSTWLCTWLRALFAVLMTCLISSGPLYTSYMYADYSKLLNNVHVDVQTMFTGRSGCTSEVVQ